MKVESITQENTRGQHILRIITVQFDYRIPFADIHLLRGAVISSVNSSNLLYHNHKGQNYRYAYSLIQYKRVNGLAAIIGINEGVDALVQYIAQCDFNLRLGRKRVDMRISKFDAFLHTLECSNQKHSYFINSWLPFNETNYHKYRNMDYLDEKIEFLEKILTANVLAFAKSMNVFFDEQIFVKLTSIVRSYKVEYKKIEVMAFDVEFETNVNLPDNIGLGSNVSLGHGTIQTIEI